MVWEVLLLVGFFLIIAVGSAIWLIKSFKPKQVGVKAYVYTVGSGRTSLNNLTKADLIPYSKDIIVKQKIDVNVDRYKLQKLGLETTKVSPEDIKIFGEERFVNVLYHGSRATILKSSAIGVGQDFEQSLTPIDFDTFTFAELQKNNRLRRLNDDKDTLSSVVRWIGIIISILAFIGIIYIQADASIQVSANNKEAVLASASANNLLAEQLARQNDLKENELRGLGISINRRTTTQETVNAPSVG